MGNSIFEFDDKFGVTSDFGDWLQTKEAIAISDVCVGVSRIRQGMYNANAEKTGQYENRVALTITVSTTGPVQTVTTDYGGLTYTGKPVVDPMTQSRSNTFIVEIDVVVPIPFQKYGIRLEIVATAQNGKSASRTIDTEVDKMGTAVLAKAKERAKCHCQGDLTVADMEAIVATLRKREEFGGDVVLRDKSNITKDVRGEPIRNLQGVEMTVPHNQYDDIQNRLFAFKPTEEIPASEKTMQSLTNVFNLAFKELGLNNCLLRSHFVAQCYWETVRFMTLYENNPSSAVEGGPLYRGRGFLQLTHDNNYKAFYKSEYGNDPTSAQLMEFVPTVATSIEIGMKASIWFWKTNNINQYAEQDDVVKVSASLNYQKALNGNESDIAKINHLVERKRFTYIAKKAFNYEECKDK